MRKWRTRGPFVEPATGTAANVDGQIARIEVENRSLPVTLLFEWLSVYVIYLLSSEHFLTFRVSSFPGTAGKNAEECT